MCVRSRASREGDEILTMWLAYVQLYDTDYHDKVTAFDHGIWSSSVPGQTVSSGGLWHSWGYMHSLKFRFALGENSNPVLAQLGFQPNWHPLSWLQNRVYSILKIFAYICWTMELLICNVMLSRNLRLLPQTFAPGHFLICSDRLQNKCINSDSNSFQAD